MSLYNNTLYNTSTYNNIASSISDLYQEALNGIDFGNGFKIPNTFCKICMIGYLDPLNASYSTNRVTQIEQRFTNIQKTNGQIVLQGKIFGDNRKNLISNIEYFKKQVEGEKEIYFKDSGVERGAKVYVEIKFSENHYNITYMDFEITATFLDYVYLAKSISYDYKNNTEQNKNFSFYNPGEETHFIGILEYSSITNNSEITVNINGIDLIIPGINSGDTIIIDTYKQDVKKNGTSLVFGGIISKLITENNLINISDNGTSRNYNFKIVYKKTII